MTPKAIEQASPDVREVLELAFETIFGMKPISAIISGRTNLELRNKSARFTRFLDAEAYTDAALMLAEPLISEGWHGTISLNGNVTFRHPTDRRLDVNAVNHNQIALAICETSIRAKGPGHE